MSKIGNSASSSTPAFRNDTNNEAKILMERKAEAFLEIKNKADSYSLEQLSRLKNFIPTLQDSSCRGKCEPIPEEFGDIEAALRLVVAHRTVYFGDKNTKTQWFGITFTRTARKLIQYIDQKLEQHKRSGSAPLFNHSRNNAAPAAAPAAPAAPISPNYPKRSTNTLKDSSPSEKKNADINLVNDISQKNELFIEMLQTTPQNKKNLIKLSRLAPQIFQSFKTLDTRIDPSAFFREDAEGRQLWDAFPQLRNMHFSEQSPLTYGLLLDDMALRDSQALLDDDANPLPAAAAQLPANLQDPPPVAEKPKTPPKSTMETVD